MDMSEVPLSVEVREGKLVIEIGLRTLTAAFLRSPTAEQLCTTESGEWDNTRCVVTEEEAFAKEVRLALTDEQEDGSNHVTRLLDEAFERVMDAGPQSVWWPDLDEPCPGGFRASDCDRVVVSVEASS